MTGFSNRNLAEQVAITHYAEFHFLSMDSTWTFRSAVKPPNCKTPLERGKSVPIMGCSHFRGLFYNVKGTNMTGGFTLGGVHISRVFTLRVFTALYLKWNHSLFILDKQAYVWMCLPPYRTVKPSRDINIGTMSRVLRIWQVNSYIISPANSNNLNALRGLHSHWELKGHDSLQKNTERSKRRWKFVTRSIVISCTHVYP